MIIAIDGPAGSGKSSTARAVARRLQFVHLDSGALYRAFAVAARRRGWADAEGAVASERVDELAREPVEAEVIDGAVVVVLNGEVLGDTELRSPEVTATASRVSAHRPVRQRVNDILRRLAHEYGRGDGGHIVCEGRDMGTVVFPDAPLKVWMDASLEERARRRLKQSGERITRASVRLEAERLESRDRADSERTESPLRRAPDALVIDTTNLSFEQQVDRIVGVARQRLDMA